MPTEIRQKVRNDPYIMFMYQTPIGGMQSNLIDWLGVLRQGAQLLGFNLASDYAFQSLCTTNGLTIIEKFPEMTLGDIQNAFKCAANGELGKEFKPYGQFGFQYVSEILRAYKRKQGEVMASYIAESKRESRAETRSKWEKTYKDIGNRIAFLSDVIRRGEKPIITEEDYQNIYGWLRQNKKIEPPNYSTFNALAEDVGMTDRIELEQAWEDWFNTQLHVMVNDFLGIRTSDLR